MNLLGGIENAMDQLTKKEMQIANFILQDPMCAVQMTAEELASAAHSSKSAYIRMCQKLGFDGYSDFRFTMSRYLVSTAGNNCSSEGPMQSILNSYSENILHIAQTVKQQDIQTLAAWIKDAKHIKIFGLNRTGLSAQQLRLRMSKIGVDAEAITDTVLMRDVSTSLHSEDICIIFSIKAMAQYHPFMKDMQTNGCKVILLTMTPKTPLRKNADLLLSFPFISRSTSESFLDDQAIFFVFIEVLLSELARAEDVSSL